MNELDFQPQQCDNLVEVDEYSEYRENKEIRNATDLFEKVLSGAISRSYKQASWMGRGCYEQLSSENTLLGKGIGPGMGSEKMRQFLDDLWRARAGDGFRGGCIRMPTESFYPLLLQYVEDSQGWKVMDPRPEGFSIFGALYREGLSGEIYKNAGINSVIPVKLYRNKVIPPFQETGSGAGIETYIRTHFSQLISSHLGLEQNSDQQAIRFDENTYFDMDGGILVRKAKTPFRIANLQMAIMQENKELTDRLVSSAENNLSRISIPNIEKEVTPSYKLAWILGDTAGKLFVHHIMHGQLNIHYQNVSIAGELADFDSTVFLDAYPDLNTIGAMINDTRMKALYASYWEKTEEGENTYSVPMRPFIQEDFERTVGGKDLSSSSADVLSANMLGQIYDLYIQALRCIDLMARHNMSRAQETGTILSDNQISEIKNLFVKGFCAQLKNQHDVNLIKSIFKKGYEHFREKYINKKSQTTIYGWHNPGTPLNHMIEKCDDKRFKFIQKDADSLNDLLRKAFDID